MPSDLFGAPVSTVSMPMVVATMFGNRDYGTIMGFFCMTPGIGGMLQVVISLVFDKTGSYNLAWIAITIAGITAVIIFTICIHTVNINRNQEKEIQ